jgi:hypothetical protein
MTNGNGKRILGALRQAPGTASEIGACLGLPMRICSAWLGMWRCKGTVEVIGKVNTGRRTSYLYAIKAKA